MLFCTRDESKESFGIVPGDVTRPFPQALDDLRGAGHGCWSVVLQRLHDPLSDFYLVVGHEVREFGSHRLWLQLPLPQELNDGTADARILSLLSHNF
jgi:hypothetical protein